MDIDISRLPYKHRFFAASLLMSKGNRLTELTALTSTSSQEKRIQRVLEGLSYYDMALSLMKRMDPNYQTLLNWKCQALISIGQYKEARQWYEELVQIAEEAEGPSNLGATAQLAIKQIPLLAGKENEPLPEINRFEIDVFDDPPFCGWAEQFCWLLRDRKYKTAFLYLASTLRESMTPADLKRMWTSMLAGSSSEVDIILERFELCPVAENSRQIGWCYFTLTSDEINEALSMEINRTSSNAYEIVSLEFGRP